MQPIATSKRRPFNKWRIKCYLLLEVHRTWDPCEYQKCSFLKGISYYLYPTCNTLYSTVVEHSDGSICSEKCILDQVRVCYCLRILLWPGLSGLLHWFFAYSCLTVSFSFTSCHSQRYFIPKCEQNEINKRLFWDLL
jgi:hypothetical protein